jgi:toxin ParE1/3/4
MSRLTKSIVLRERANNDIEAAVEHYLRESAEAALGFLDSLERAFQQIGLAPAAGSPKYAHALEMPGLRFRVCVRYPYLIFYVEQADCVDVWRVLHAQRDIPAHLEFQ